MSFVRAVLFDWAGTMVDFGCLAPVLALQSVFAGRGVAVSEADIRRDMGLAKRDHVRALLNHPRTSSAWIASHGAQPTEADGEAIMAALSPMMESSARQMAKLIPGAAATAATLSGWGIRLGSCTGYTRSMISPVLPLAAAEGYSPEVVVCAGETPAGRPSPLMLWQALIHLGVWPASGCVKVDDAEVGIGEGRAAGAWTVGVTASGNAVGLSLEAFNSLSADDRRARLDAAARGLTEAGADYVIETVADLPSVILEIDQRLAAGERPRPADISAWTARSTAAAGSR